MKKQCVRTQHKAAGDQMKIHKCANRYEKLKQKTPAQQSCAGKAGFLYLLKQQFPFSLKHKY